MRTIPVLYEDKNLIVVSKPSGMMVHNMGENPKGKNAVLSVLESSCCRQFFPVHPMDRGCSGIVVLAKSVHVARELIRVWHSTAVIQTTLVLVKGCFESSGTFRFPLKSWTGFQQPAITHYAPVWNQGQVSLLKVFTETECRHQIRRHFSRRCANIIGDRRYGQGRWNFVFQNTYDLNRMFMHVSYIKLALNSYKKPVEIHCPLTEDLRSVLRLLAVFPSFYQPARVEGGYFFQYRRKNGFDIEKWLFGTSRLASNIPKDGYMAVWK